jgi:hypothetical protein
MWTEKTEEAGKWKEDGKWNYGTKQRQRQGSFDGGYHSIDNRTPQTKVKGQRLDRTH